MSHRIKCIESITLKLKPKMTGMHFPFYTSSRFIDNRSINLVETDEEDKRNAIKMIKDIQDKRNKYRLDKQKNKNKDNNDKVNEFIDNDIDIERYAPNNKF